jgi:hypothetical protein
MRSLLDVSFAAEVIVIESFQAGAARSTPHSEVETIRAKKPPTWVVFSHTVV